MVAKLARHRLAQLPRLGQGERSRLELGHHAALTEGAQIATALAAALVVRRFARQLVERPALAQLGQQLLGPCLGLRVVAAGLKPADKIIVKGLVRPGMQVVPQMISMAPGDTATDDRAAADSQEARQ